MTDEDETYHRIMAMIHGAPEARRALERVLRDTDDMVDTEAPCHVCKGLGSLLSQERNYGPITSEACWHCRGTGKRTTKVMRERT